MMEIVDRDRIEGIVGVTRHAVQHYARAVSSEQNVYILHSQKCLWDNPDLLTCPFSIALSKNGIDIDNWVEDVPFIVTVEDERLVLMG